MSSSPELSVIIVNFHTPELVIECVRSIKENTTGVDYEIIIVDNGSSDDSLIKLKNLSTQDNVTLIESKQNLGFAKGSNLGIGRAKGEYLLLLNSDTFLVNNALSLMLKFARENKSVGVVGAQLLNKDRSVQPSCYRLPTIIRAIRHYWLGEKGLLDKYAPESAEPVPVEAVVGAVFLITPQSREKVGLMDEKYFFYFEDLDYCRKVNRSGLKVYYHPQAKIVHYHGASTKVSETEDQWKRLIPSSKLYHGTLNHYILNFVIWSRQKVDKLFSKKEQ